MTTIDITMTIEKLDRMIRELREHKAKLDTQIKNALACLRDLREQYRQQAIKPAFCANANCGKQFRRKKKNQQYCSLPCAKADPGRRKRVSDRMKTYWADPDRRKRLSDSLKEVNDWKRRTGWKRWPEVTDND